MDNKKQMLASLSDSDFQGLTHDGELCFYSPFELEHDRARIIMTDIHENIQEYIQNEFLTGDSEHLVLKPNDFIRIAARNIDLQNPIEIAHFIFVCGRDLERLMESIKAVESKNKI